MNSRSVTKNVPRDYRDTNAPSAQSERLTGVIVPKSKRLPSCLEKEVLRRSADRAMNMYNSCVSWVVEAVNSERFPSALSNADDAFTLVVQATVKLTRHCSEHGC